MDISNIPILYHCRPHFILIRFLNLRYNMNSFVHPFKRLNRYDYFVIVALLKYCLPNARFLPVSSKSSSLQTLKVLRRIQSDALKIGCLSALLFLVFLKFRAMRKHGKFKFIALTTDPKSGPLSCAMLWNFGDRQIAHRRRYSAWDFSTTLPLHFLFIACQF